MRFCFCIGLLPLFSRIAGKESIQARVQVLHSFKNIFQLLQKLELSKYIKRKDYSKDLDLFKNKTTTAFSNFHCYCFNTLI